MIIYLFFIIVILNILFLTKLQNNLFQKYVYHIIETISYKIIKNLSLIKN